jgi:hypothetical protein
MRYPGPGRAGEGCGIDYPVLTAYRDFAETPIWRPFLTESSSPAMRGPSQKHRRSDGQTVTSPALTPIRETGSYSLAASPATGAPNWGPQPGPRAVLGAQTPDQ